MNPPGSQLDYAPRPAWPRRKRTRLAIVCVLIIGAAASIKWVGPAWRRARMLYWQKQCLTCDGADWPVGASAPPNPQAAAWNHFYALFSPPGRHSGAVVFLHEMRRKDGAARLVAVEAAAAPPRTAGPTFVTFDITVVKPGSLIHAPALAGNSATRFQFDDDGSTARNWRFGRLDAGDPAHVVLVLQTTRRDVIFDGWLGNDDRLVIEPRDPSAPRGN